MITHLRRSAWLFAGLLTAGFTVGVINAWTSFGIMIAFCMVMLWPVVLFVLVVGLGVAIGGGIRAGRRERSAWRMAACILAGPVAIIAALVLFLPAVWAGVAVGDWSRLALNEGRYRAIIAKAETAVRHDGAFGFHEENGLRYVVDPGPPVRVAFNPEGLLDNWSGIIFDPTGEVMKAQGLDEGGTPSGPPEVVKLFGGDLLGCKGMWGPWYRCSFT